MTLGQKIKQARMQANLTQKDLADKLSVTFQTVSKWESDTNEPDLTTLRAIAKTTKVSLEYLISEEEESSKKSGGASPAISMQRRQIGICSDCHSPLMEGQVYHNVERRSKSGIKESVMICDSCFKKEEEEIEKKIREIESSGNEPEPKKKGLFNRIASRDDKKPLAWSIVLGVVGFIVALVICIINYSSVGIGWTIGAPILIGYALMATIYCIFTYSYISEVFLAVASWSIRFPGIIFSWDLDGIKFLIAMKLLFWVLGAMISIGTFLLALSLSALLSVFSFVPLLIYNKTHYE